MSNQEKRKILTSEVETYDLSQRQKSFDILKLTLKPGYKRSVDKEGLSLYGTWLIEQLQWPNDMTFKHLPDKIEFETGRKKWSHFKLDTCPQEKTNSNF